MVRSILFLAGLAAISIQQVFSCTNFIVTKGASADGSVMITYAADSHIRYGELYFRPGGIHPEGSMVKLFDRGSNRLLGEIPQAKETFNVVGFMNEYQVAIGETTFGGRPELTDTTGIIDYGSLMFLAMQRARTAREAIAIIADLVEKYGYYSSGESFSISDKNEAWIMEIIGKGTRMEQNKQGQWLNRNKGAVWVAVRIPDGYVSAHANQARIMQFQMEDGKRSISSKNLKKISEPGIEVVYASDVIRFAREKGYFAGKDEEFSFSDVYAPMTFDAARFCEMRVWAFFKDINPGMTDYMDYASGKNLSHRMPLYIKPARQLTPADLMRLKRDHLQGTPFDMTKDPGAGPFGLPYRWRPLTWKVDGVQCFHERATQTQQTGFSYVAQSRSWLPDPIGGIMWFGVDDAGTTVYVPFYCGITQIPISFAEGNGSILKYSETAAFWKFNKLAHLAYLFYDRMMPDVVKAQSGLEGSFPEKVRQTDARALALFETDPKGARALLTGSSREMAEQTMEKWEELYRFLLVKFLDGNVKQEKDGQFLENGHGYPKPPAHPGYPENYLRDLKQETGDRFIAPKKSDH